MYDYKARIYSPTLGRFLQTDPIGYDGGENLYAYVGDDPVDKVDFTGDQPGSSGAPQCPTTTINSEASSHCVSSTSLVDGAESSIEAGAKGTAEGLSASAHGIGEAIQGTAQGVGQALDGVNQALGGVATAADSALTAARDAASAAVGALLPSKGATTALVTKDGAVTIGHSLRSGGPGSATNARVAAALARVPTAERSNFHGCCGEVHAISNALNAGRKVVNGEIATVRTKTGKWIEPCGSCMAVLHYFGIRF
jgi:hypothetical protein